MVRLAEFILGLLSLIEAEGRLLRLNTLILTRGIIFILMGFICGAGALAFFLAALYKALILVLPELLSLVIMGGACSLLAIIFIWSVPGCRRKTRKNIPTSKA